MAVNRPQSKPSKPTLRAVCVHAHVSAIKKALVDGRGQVGICKGGQNNPKPRPFTRAEIYSSVFKT